MHKEFLMGNEAIGKACIAAGVNVVAGYPGTPSTEVLETIAKENDGSVYVEWSVNEKAALEVAAGAAYSGARTLVTMKQVGLNVASDPLMSLEYVGVKGGMVVLVADDHRVRIELAGLLDQQLGIASGTEHFNLEQVRMMCYNIQGLCAYGACGT